MKNLFFVLMVLFVAVKVTMAQPGQLLIKGGDKGLHLEHPVAAKEGFFAIARLYNVHPKFLAVYNSLDINKGLNIGQIIYIPLTDTNFSQTTSKGMPVYYKTGNKEGLMKISNANNKVKLQSIRQWNKLTNDNIATGTKLIVGFLIPGEAPVAAAPVKEEAQKIVEQKPVVKIEPISEKPVAKTEDIVTKPVVKEEVKKAEPPVEKPLVKEEPRKVQQPAVTKQEVTMNMSGQGYFKSFFDQQVKANPVSKTETVTSGIFKTTNGLQDAKYYLLMDGVSSGTIVRIINPENNKTVYAKVLGEMNGIRQNQGLNIRISNLAAATLGINEMDKFIVKLNY